MKRIAGRSVRKGVQDSLVRNRRRRSLTEKLERRDLLATAIWHNPISGLDVTGDQPAWVSAMDALNVINDLNRHGPRPLPKQSDSSGGPPYVDSNCDGYVNAIDALVVINHLNRFGPGQVGGLSSEGGYFVSAACSPKIIEGSGFVTDFERVLKVPANRNTLVVTFEAPAFDGTAKGQVRDALEIWLKDDQQRPLNNMLSSTRRAVLNWTEGFEPVIASGALLERSDTTQELMLHIDISEFAVDSDVTLVTRLINNDRDDQTSVIVRGFEFRDLGIAYPSWLPAFSESRLLPNEKPIDLDSLTDVTGLVSMEYGRTSLSLDGKDLISQLTIKNESTLALTMPMVAVFEGGASAEVSLLRPDGVLEDGRPFKIIRQDASAHLGPDSDILFGPEFAIRNETGGRFDIGMRIYAALHRTPPAFLSKPVTEIEAGKRYRYSTRATAESDGALVYSMIRGPEEMSLDPNSGELVWATQLADVGAHDVVLRVTDRFGLSVDQAFSIVVMEQLTNRPPMFVSEPELQAIAAGAFDVITLPTGSLPTGLALGSFGEVGGDPQANLLSIVAINQGSQTVSLIPGLGRDGAGREIYGPGETLGVGEPPLGDELFRSVLDIDVGLPPFGNTTYDLNRIMGLAHGDFNGDGILDVATSIVFQYRTFAGTDHYERRIAITLGNGDGTFAPAIHLPIPGPVAFASDSLGAISLRADDFDGDGKLDLLVSETKGKKLLFYKGLGTGSFAPATLQSTGTDIAGFKVADLNDDAKLDLIALRADGRAFGVLTGNGDGSFEAFAAFTTHTGDTVNHNFALGDLNGDGLIDFVSGNHSTRSLNIYFGNGDGTFSRSVDLPARGVFSTNPSSLDWPMALVIGDFTGNGHADIAYTTYSNSGFGTGYGGGIALYEGDGSGTLYSWKTAVDLAMSLAPMNIHGDAKPVDLNGDGYLDLVFTGPGEWGNFAPGVNVALNDGTGKFTSTFWIDSNMGTDPQPGNLNNGLGVLVGDFNKDGLLDLLTARNGRQNIGRQFSSVSLMLADQPGSYRAAYDARLQSGPWGTVSFVEYADFNNDGILDIWGPAYQNPSFTQLGNGDGTFQRPITATPYIGNEGLGKGFVSDLDLDGNMDVVWFGGGGVQGGPQGRYLAALGNGDGTFQISFAQTGNNTPSGYAPLVMKPADFDGDGHMDFVALTGLATVEIMRNVPDVPGTFTRSFSLPFGSSTLRPSIAAGDFDGDGLPDVIAVREKPNRVHDLLFYKGKGDGTLAEPISFPFAPDRTDFRFPQHIAVGDLNRDGNLDFVINASYNRSAVALGNGNGTFQTPLVYRTGTIFGGDGGLHLIDLNGDGHLDLVSGNDEFNNSPRSIEIRLGLGDGTFGDAQLWGTSEGIGRLVFGDLDNDGRLDVGYNGSSRQEAVATYLGRRQGLSGVLTTDINRDGRTDILAINHDNSHVKRLINDGRGHFTRMHDLLVGAGPVELLSGDFNSNGRTDFLTINRSGRSISIMLADGLDGYARTDVPVGRLPVSGALAKVTGGEHDDLLVIDAQLNALFIMTQDGTGAFTESALIPLGDKPSSIAVGDIDGDGGVDVIISLVETNRLMVLRNRGSGQFADPTYVNLPAQPGKIAAGDLNGDGLLDLAVTFPEAGEVALLLGMGQSRFTQPQRIRVGSQPDSIVMADANGDGLQDILVTNAGDNTASVILNRFDPNQLYRYDALAIDPDDDPVNYSILEGPGGMILDPVTGEIRWAPMGDQIGLQRVVLEANDGRGGRSTQEFSISVEAARTNAAPVITTLPSTVVSAEHAFTTNVSATDPDGDRLRYRLVQGPEGASIDPVTGQIDWDPRGTAMLMNRVAQANGFVQIPHTAAQNVNSLTVEGWFRFAKTNGNQVLIDKALNWVTPGFFTLRYFSGNLQFLIGNGAAAGTETLSLVRSLPTEEWIHLSATFADTTGEMALLINGIQVASRVTSKRIGTLSENIPLWVGQDVYPFHGDVYGFRMWDAARTTEQIKEAMHQPMAAGTPNLVVDLRFNEGDSLSVINQVDPNHRGLSSGAVLPKRIVGMAPLQTAQFTVSVEDGKGGFDLQTFSVTVAPKLPGSITGTLFSDDNRDGSRQAGEAALSGWTLFIDHNRNGYRDIDEPFAVTNASGAYQFNQLLQGDYTVAAQPRAGFMTPPARALSVVSLQATSSDIAAEPLSLGQVRGRLMQANPSQPLAYQQIFADLNRNGMWDDGEPTTITDVEGRYAIGGLQAGNYSLRVQTQAAWRVTQPASAAHDVVLAHHDMLGDLDFVVQPSNSVAATVPQIITLPPRSAAVGQPYRYAVSAISRDGGSIAYSLSLAPAGMVIDSRTGQIVWTPTGKQTGSQQVIVRAATDNSHVDLQAYSIDVAPANTAPVVTSSPVGSAAVGRVWSYPVIAQDAEQSELAYSLSVAPFGATIEAETGLILWAPSVSQMGTHAFHVNVHDKVGGVTQHWFTLDVISDTPSALPFTIRSPRDNASLLTPYLSRVSGVDSSGQPLTVSLLSGPDGLTLDASGFIQWSPSVAQLGLKSLSVRFNSASGSSEEHTYTIAVRQTMGNSVPRIQSNPGSLFAVAGQFYVYDLMVSDADQDALSFELLAAPAGMSIHPQHGTLRWLPTLDQLGQSSVTIRVTDPQGGSDIQSFTLTTRRLGGPPLIQSVPPTQAAVGVGYLYTVQAVDAENDPLTYGIIEAPGGMTINSRTGEIAWTPTTEQFGKQSVFIVVSDASGNRSTQGFSIQVAAGLPNRPPVLSSQPNLFASVGQLYSTTLQATDPEGTTVTYSLRRGPEGMTIDPATGLVRWTPVAGQTGRVIVTLVALDEQAGASVQSFEIDVLGINTPPEIITTPPALAWARGLFQYDVIARDSDRDPIRYEFVSSVPDGMTIDPLGRIRWQTRADDVGSYSVTVRASDPRGGYAMQHINFEVRADNVPPKVTVLPRGGGWPWDGPIVVFVSAVDIVGVVNVELRVNGQVVPLDVNRTARLSFDDWGPGVLNMVATARDAAGNEATGTATSFYRDPEVDYESGEGLPVASMTTPTEDATVYGMVQIVGTAIGGSAAATGFKEYRLSYARLDQLQFTEFAHSTTPVADGLLGVWDTTLLENDAYVLRLEVVSEAGNTSVHETTVGLSGNLKLGNFRLSFEDLTIPMAGIPITIVRTYDTLRADRDGDFGYGWRLEYRNTDLRVSLPKSGLEDLGIFTPFRSGTKIYLTLPGGQRVGWTFTPEMRVLPGWAKGNDLVMASPRYTPDRDNTATLSAGSGWLTVNQFGELYATGGIPWNPASPDFGGGFKVTTADGLVYFVDGVSGKLVTATDRNGNSLNFSEQGISSSVGNTSIQITRDRNGRVASITDPAGHSILYRYSPDGNLIGQTDRDGNQTRFNYRSDKKHYLESVTDPLNRTGIRTEYDADNRLVGLTNATGSTSLSQYDIANGLVRNIDSLNRVTITEFDGFGNVSAVTSPSGAVTRYGYDDYGRLASTEDALGNVTRTVFDWRGNLSQSTDALGRTTRYQYDQKGNATQIVDAMGGKISLEYDLNGNNTVVRDAMGRTLKYRFDAIGNPLVYTDPLGQEVSFQYDSLGRLIGSIDASGQANQYEYDLHGNVTNSNGGDVQFKFSAGGKPKSVTVNGQQRSLVVDAAGRIMSAENESGARSQYHYNAVDQLIEVRLPDGAVLGQAVYDSVGRKVSTTDLSGNITRYEYDSEDRVVLREYADGSREEFEYDLIGNLVKSIDRRGAVTQHFYSSTGKLQRTIDPLGYATEYVYDDLDQLIETIDADGNVSKNIYDASGLLVSKIDGSLRRTEFLYDGAGRLVEVIDAGGRSQAYRYDAAGRLSATTDGSGIETRYRMSMHGITEEIDGNGNWTKTRYDAHGRPVRTEFANGSFEEKRYDAIGLLVGTSNGATSVQYEYDDFLNISRITTSENEVETFTYTWDSLLETATNDTGTTRVMYHSVSRLPLKVIEPDGRYVRYEYDVSGNRTLVATGWENQLDESITAYEYDIAGRLVSMLDPLGRRTSYEYTAAGRLSSVKQPNGIESAYGYDGAGRITSIVHRSGDLQVLSGWTYEYDGSGNRIAERGFDGSVATFEYDLSNRVSSEVRRDKNGILIGEARYRYDRVGNLVARSGNLLTETTFQYDVSNQLLTGLDLTYSYDAAGNLSSVTSDTGVTLYDFDARGRLRRVTLESGEVVTYRYDFDGRQISRADSSGEVVYWVDRFTPNRQHQVLREALNGIDLRLFVTSNTATSVIEGTDTYFFHRDAIGSIRLWTDSAGSILARQNYSAYGEELAGGDTIGGNGFLGERRDRSTGMIDLRARVYDVSTGRFLSRDPLPGDPKYTPSMNPYVYAHGNPVTLTDPTGMMTLAELQTTLQLRLTQFSNSTYRFSQTYSRINDALGTAATRAGGLMIASALSEPRLFLRAGITFFGSGFAKGNFNLLLIGVDMLGGKQLEFKKMPYPPELFRPVNGVVAIAWYLRSESTKTRANFALMPGFLVASEGLAAAPRPFIPTSTFGVPSMAGIMVHEMSHATLNTKDHAYNTRSLVISDGLAYTPDPNQKVRTPTQALENADSYRAVAEAVTVGQLGVIRRRFFT